MTQKDNVKQLIGKSLNAYNNKVLQQIDRIEKKNKQQNHKISMLTNELDNDYLTKTEEGSVISLEHSKEGMVYIDSLEGNTLVNYCTDGSKELTLNGDIDLEGTFVTTTEGVDNGKVDVMCEGNTLVNLVCKNYENILIQGKGAINNYDDTITLKADGAYNKLYFGQKTTTNKQITYKPSTTYTLIINVITNTLKNKMLVGFGNLTTGIFTKTYTTPSDLSSLTNNNLIILEVNPMYHEIDSGEIVASFMLLEGDWTNKEIPPYFEGMKSVGQDDENGHKIEILSRNDKLIINKDKLLNEGIFYGTKGWSAIRLVIKAKRVKIVVTNKDGLARKTKLSVKNDIESEVRARQLFGMNESFNKVEIDYELLDTNILSFCVYGENDFNGDFFDYYDIEVFSYDNIEDVTPTTRYNKKEILLNEPLRALPNGVKDRIVKIGGKSYIERNCGEITFNGEETIKMETSTIYTRFVSEEIINAKSFDVRTECLFDKFTFTQGHTNRVGFTYMKKIFFYVDECATVDEFKIWLQNNPTTVVYQLATPTYEPITDAELITYLDTTHISNNSLIPCTMKIKNSGYNAIIKPNTLYTVALDANKSGTIGMNLGGVKGTTTNNVLKLTTPATLTDDSLRLYGKGIKGSKVRLLEGDKTNWIPSHFEGMKSSFEDKFDTTDNTYKMEILSKNRNLLEVEKLIDADNYIKGTYSSIKIPLKPNTRYYYNFDFQPNNIHRWVGVFSEPKSFKGSITKTLVWNEAKDGIKSGYIQTDNSTEYYLSVYQPNVNYHTNDWYKELFTTVCKNFVISEIESEYIDGLSNKIQFSSIEPLRSVGNIKDKFIFKDGKLMIERNIGQTVLNGSEKWSMERHYHYTVIEDIKPLRVWIGEYQLSSDRFTEFGGSTVPRDLNIIIAGSNKNVILSPKQGILHNNTTQEMKEWLSVNPTKILYQLETPIYEEIPFELQKIILEGYENGTLFFDTNIPPTSTVTYAGETPIVKSVRLNKTEVLNNTNDINDNIVPYLMDMDYRVVCLELATETQGISMARLFGGVYEMLKRDILSGRLSKEEYGYRLADYFNAGKLTEQQVKELEDLR